MRRSLVLVVGAAGAGAIATAVAASSAAMPGRDVAQLVALAVGTAAVGCLGAAVLLRLRARTSLAGQVVLLSLCSLTAVAGGAWVGAQAMFISTHDLQVLVVLLCAAGTVGICASLVIGRRIGRDHDALIGATRELGSGHPMTPITAKGASTEARELALELATTARRLEEARQRERAMESSRRELVAWISHDLRTPLSGLRAIAEALEDGVVGDEAPRYHALMREETERLSALVDDLFELSRTQAGVLRLDLQVVSLGDVVSDAIAGITPVARAKRVHVESRLGRELPNCSVAPSELLRALRNILENAVRHTPSDGTVVVEATVDNADAFVSVIDDGGGIPTDDIARVFETGFRGDPARSGDAGAGLGLAIARSIVEAHRGDIAVRNENGGARFTIRLPLDSGG